MGQYNPVIHHRRSIRLKGHDYAGGGLYFVTLCAHREVVEFAAGNPLADGEGDRCPASRAEEAAHLVPRLGPRPRLSCARRT